jgi:uncharacterized protein (TIGR02118 family)
MYKLIAYWTAPQTEQTAAFERQYWDVHIPLAAAVPSLVRLVLTQTPDGLEGGAPGFYRIAELVWNSAADFEACAESAEWHALREDAGRLVEKYGVELAAGLGEEYVQPLPTQIREVK